MKSCVKKIGATLLAAALGACALTACTPYAYYEVELASKPTMTEYSFDEETGMHTILVEGLAANVSGIFVANAQVSVEFYDELGDPMDLYGYAYLEGIDVGEVWHYYVLVETEKVPADFDVVAISYNW